MILTEARTNISAGTYLARPAERLVLEGYRGWTWTLARASREPLTRTCRLYRSELGEHAGPVLEALKGFALALGLGTTRSLKMCCAEAPALCLDEVLVLGLIAAIQHSDEQGTDWCLARLSHPLLFEPLSLAAGSYALLLRGLGRTLLPIPLGILEAVELGNAAPDKNTVH